MRSNIHDINYLKLSIKKSKKKVTNEFTTLGYFIILRLDGRI